MTVDHTMRPLNATPACGEALRAPLAGGPVWYWSYWFSVGVPTARSC